MDKQENPEEVKMPIFGIFSRDRIVLTPEHPLDGTRAFFTTEGSTIQVDNPEKFRGKKFHFENGRICMDDEPPTPPVPQLITTHRERIELPDVSAEDIRLNRPSR